MANQEGLRERLEQAELQLRKARSKYDDLLKVFIVSEGDRVPTFMTASEWLRRVTECVNTIERLEKQRDDLVARLADHGAEGDEPG